MAIYSPPPVQCTYILGAIALCSEKRAHYFLFSKKVDTSKYVNKSKQNKNTLLLSSTITVLSTTLSLVTTFTTKYYKKKKILEK